jgi:hypothetical protein
MQQLLPQRPSIWPPRLSQERRTSKLSLAELLPALALLGVMGCGGASSANPTAGPISFAGGNAPNGKVTSLAVASTLQLSMMPIGDRMAAGVDWAVTCGGNPITGSVVNGACGTLAPVHTGDGSATVYTAPSVVPIGATITITATVTSNPSQSSSVSLTIVALPIAVSLTTSVPASLNVNQTLSLAAQVTNDPTGAGVIWMATCGSAACGSFNPTETLNTIYTAPSVVPTGGTVTINATSLTDTTRSASATLTIASSSSGVPVAVSVSPASAYVQTAGAAHSTHFTALVANDPAQAGVDWSVSCGASSCGGVNPGHTASGAAVTYSAPSAVPPAGTVTITAKSTTDPTASASATANIVTSTPVVVSISSAPPPMLTVGSTSTLAASVASDPNNLGVNWTASCGSSGACGSFNLSPAHTASGGQIIYTAPGAVPAGGGVVTIMAASPAMTPSNSGIAFTTIVALPPSLALTQLPPATLASTAQAPVSATVTNDVAPGGVTWSVQCGSTIAGGCGYIAPVQTASGATAIYTAPPVTATGTSVTLVATSLADSSVSITSNPIAIVPATTLSVEFVPSLPAQVQPNGTVNLNAAVVNDATAAGVDWQVCASGCGFFTVKPAVPAIPATPTTPYVPAVPAMTATTVSAWSNGLPIPYTAPAQPPASGVVVVAAAHVDPTRANSGTIAINASAAGPALNGVALAGAQPIVGASVSLYAAGTSGYGSAASQIATATTGKSGSFTVPAGYTCPSSSSEMYLVAIGGAVGANVANPSLVLMAALGSCGTLGSGPVFVNEATTIASAFATAPFAANNALSGNSSYLYLGASSGNLTGLANAFAAVNNLVDVSTGQLRYFTPAGNAEPPYVEINTLADALNACAATSGGIEGDGSACGTLFSATDVLPQHTLYNSVAPVNTLQAAFNIAQHPVTNYGYVLDPSPQRLLGLATTASPYQPILTQQPNDWSISLNYSGGGGGLSSTSSVGSLAIDASGDLWITDTAANTVIEWNVTGAAISPESGFSSGGGPIAIDANGNVWTSGNGALYELNSLGSPAPGSPFGGAAGGGSDMSIDAQSNLWIANGGGVSEFSDLGVAVSPAGGFAFDGLSGIGAVGVDDANNIWIGNTSGSQANIAELSNPGATLIVNGQSGATGEVLPQLASDGAGHLWAIVNPSQNVCEIPPYGGRGSVLLPTCYGELQNANTPGELNFFNAAGVAVDGAGTAWVASEGGGNPGFVIPPSILPIAPSLFAGGGFPTYLASPSLAAGPLGIAVDGSGNLWVLLANNTVTEYVGVATPVVTPIALGLMSKKLGAKP